MSDRLVNRLAMVGVGIALVAVALVTSAFVRVQASGIQSGAAVSSEHLYLSIVTPDQTGKDGYPAYVPTNLVLPAHATVTITITDFDSAGALPAKYAVVHGTVGNTITVAPIDPSNPNNLGPSRQVRSENANTGVAHTFTAVKLGLNVPVAPNAVTTFTIRTGGAGVYTWQCMDPCGTGPQGMGGPMVEAGYMSGKITIQ